jgi:hypothetical protein
MALDVCQGESPWAPVNLELAEYNPDRYLLTYKFLIALRIFCRVRSGQAATIASDGVTPPAWLWQDPKVCNSGEGRR